MGNHWACIINPEAGNRYPAENLEHTTKILKNRKPEIQIFLTKKPGHATEIAAQCVEKKIDTILVMGGDGTVNEVAQVLVDRKEIAMGVISGGTGNDFNYMAGFPDRFGQSEWDALFSRTAVPVDVGICNGKYFFNGMGIGFDATMSAASHADREKTGKSGKGRYNWIILKTLIGYREQIQNIQIDDETIVGQSFMTTISIGRRFAGSYFLTPTALPNDGLLDICEVSPIKLLKRLQILIKVPKGTHIYDPAVRYGTCKSCRIEFQQETPAHLDGELIFADTFTVSIKPAALNLLVNPGNPEIYQIYTAAPAS